MRNSKNHREEQKNSQPRYIRQNTQTRFDIRVNEDKKQQEPLYGNKTRMFYELIK